MKRKIRTGIVSAIVFTALLFSFTLYVALDTFVIPRSYATEQVAISPSYASGSETETTSGETSEETEPSSEATTESSTPVVTETSYSDGNVTIELTTYYEYDTAIYVADVQASSVEYLKAAFADGTYGRNITDTTSGIASDNDAILAVNGDFYGSQEKGYVIRNGVLYRSSARSGQEDLVIYYDGTFEIICEDDVTAEELLENGAWQVFSFGPGIISDGEIAVTEDEEVGKAKASNPRTAIGIIDETHYVLVVSDGRTDESEGLSLYQLAEFMQSLGVTESYNLDGGGSSTMYFNGEVVNNPTSSGNSIKERSVSDIIYF